MAEPTPAPALPSTADPTPYVPVSWMAVSAIAVASLFVGILLALGVSAFLAKKPLIQPELLVLPALGIVLSFAARRVIRNAEGTRTGENLANTAWWISLVAGLGYAAYLLAIDFAIRRDARGTLDRWIESIRAGDAESLNEAFLRTREPGQRGKISAKDTAQIQGRFRDDYLAFKQCDLVRIAQRNKGACEIVPESVKEWTYRTGGIECLFNGTVKCPEGKFPFVVGLRGADPTSSEMAGRQWWVAFAPNKGYFQRDQMAFTPYGWLLYSIEQSGTVYANQFILSVRAGAWAMPYAYQAMMKTDSPDAYGKWQATAITTPSRMAVTGVLAATAPYTSDYLAYSFPDHFYKTPGGGEPTVAQRDQFKKIWETTGLMQVGGRLKNNPDAQTLVDLSDSSVEVRVPCELPFPGQDTASAARGRIVVVSTDPELLRDLKRLRSEADPEQTSSNPPSNILQRSFKWRIVRLESDMTRVQMQQTLGSAPIDDEEVPGIRKQ
jgi:hypothetical protein